MRKNDLIFIVLIIAFFSALLLLTKPKEEGKYIVVSIGGENDDIYLLTDYKQTVNIGENNIITIDNNKAYMSYARCPDQICVNEGSISKSGEEIVCMPNKVIVRVKSGEYFEK